MPLGPVDLVHDPVEVAPRIWWVGAVLEGDSFQAHPYLIEAGDRSVLVDPGSTLTIDVTLDKVRRVLPLERIAYVLIHHSDPDVADALHRLDEILDPARVTMITEWRSALLTRHYGSRLPVATVEDLGWGLDLDEGRRLEFVSTPYLHFPGAFVTYETASRALLSADLFGGFNDGTRLVATSMDDFEALRRFHEHYMPSRDLLLAGLATIRVHAPRIDHVLPQHGFVIPPELVDPMFDRLAGLDCGLMALAGRDASIEALITDAATVHRFADDMAAVADVADAFRVAASVFAELLPLERIEVEIGDEGGARWSTGRTEDGRIDWRSIDGWTRPDDHTLVIPLDGTGIPASGASTPEETGEPAGDVESIVVVHLTEPSALRPHLVPMLRTVLPTVHALVTHLVRDHDVAEAIDELRHQATHDPLTGLFNREHLRYLVVARPEHLWVMLLDLDHFKRVNDELGHLAGDDVLRQVAAVLSASVRGEDRVVRYGGEEFLVLLPCAEAEVAERVAERIRSGIAERVATALGPVTVSIGLAAFHEGEALEAAIGRADAALYAAKAAGRNRVEIADQDRPA